MMIRRMLRQIFVVSAGASALAGCTMYDGYGRYGMDPYYDRQTDDWYVVASIDGLNCYPVAYDPFYDASYYALMGYGWSPVDCGNYYRRSPYASGYASIYYGYHYGAHSPFWYGYSPGYYSGYYYGRNAGYRAGYGYGYNHGYYYDPYWGYYPWGHYSNKKKRKPILTTADGRRERISPEVDYDETIRHRVGVAPNWPTPTGRFRSEPNSSGPTNSGPTNSGPAVSGTGWASDAPAARNHPGTRTQDEFTGKRRIDREPVFRPPSHASAPRSAQPSSAQPAPRPTSRPAATQSSSHRPPSSQPSPPRVAPSAPAPRPTVAPRTPTSSKPVSRPTSRPAPAPKTKSAPAPKPKSNRSRPNRK